MTTDDSILKAIAAAPARQPPEVRRSERRRVPLFVLGLALVAAVVAIGLALRSIAAPPGLPIATWQLDGADVHHVAVELPSTLFDQLGLRDADFTLSTTLELAREQRDGALTVAIPCFHGPLSLAVDGTPVPDSGDPDVGDHRFVLRGEGHPRRSLVLSAHRDLGTGIGFGVAPHVSSGDIDTGTAARIGRYSVIVAIVLGLLGLFLYGMLYALDRRREYLAYIVGVTGSLITTVFLLGLVHLSQRTVGDRVIAALSMLAAPLIFIGLLYFVHYAFSAARPPRWLLVVFAAFALISMTSIAIPSLLLVAGLSMSALSPIVFAYLTIMLVRLALRGEHRLDARILLVWLVPQIGATIVENYWRITGTNVLGGVHAPPLLYCVLLVAQNAVLVRQFAARQRTIEHTSAQLRLQVAERSKQLADMLASIANQPSAPLKVEQIIADTYRVVRELGAGGMGTVYEVERISDHRHFALKTMRDRVDTKLMARFAREGQLAATITHPNLVPVIDVGASDGRLYLVMDLVAGTSLERDRVRFGDMKWATPLLVQIARGLAALHERGIVHRDLKPANVLVANGVARIADFGLAALYDRTEVGALDDTTPHSPMLTRVGDVFGTPAYMAPELAAGAQATPPSSDVFSFGVMAFELLAGRAPFGEPPVVSRSHGHTIVIPDPPSGRHGALVARCLTLSPNERPTAAELVATLERE